MSKRSIHHNRFLLSIIAVVISLVVIAGIFTMHREETVVAPAEKLSHTEYQAEEDELIRRMKNSGVESGFDYAREKLVSDARFARDCHPLLHRLGHAAVEQYGSFNDALTRQDEMCNSGYIHGVVEAGFFKSTDIESTVNSVCQQNGLQNFNQWQCFHGIGHGVMYATGKDVDKSAKLCETLDTSFAVGACINGLFMERFILVNHSGEQVASHGASGLSVCKQQEDRHKSDCYIYVQTAYLALQINDYHGAIINCQEAEKDYIDTCISGVGAHAMKENITRPAFAASLCRRAVKQYRNDCARGALSLFINHHVSSSAAVPLCDQEFEPFKQTCHAVIESKKLNLAI